LRILEAQDNFLNEGSLLETVILAVGHEIIFYPKFHYELNYIEYYQGRLKRYTRDNCKYSFADPENTIFQAMDNLELQTIRRFAMRSNQPFDICIHGSSIKYFGFPSCATYIVFLQTSFVGLCVIALIFTNYIHTK
jgi:hypothetical protein